MTKRILAVLLCITVAFTSVNLSVYAEKIQEGMTENGEAFDLSQSQIITVWSWGEENVPQDGTLTLTDENWEGKKIEDVASRLPAIMATLEGSEDLVPLTLIWACAEFPDSAAPGEYTFTATLPEGYVLGEQAETLPALKVVLAQTQAPAESSAPNDSPVSAESSADDAPAQTSKSSTPLNDPETVETGAFLVTGDTENYSYDAGLLTITGGEVTVANKDSSVATAERIYIEGEATVTLAGVNIATAAGAPVEVKDYSDTNVTIILENENTLVSRCSGKAGLHKSRGQHGGSEDTSTLVIRGDGSLTAVGGSDAAGIGAGTGKNEQGEFQKGDLKNLTIESGNITAEGKSTGIGAGSDGSVWDLYITGGNIKATGEPGHGIGGSGSNGVSDVSIEGGFVTANGCYKNSPVGGIVSLDGGSSYTVYGDQTLEESLTIPEGTKWYVEPGNSLTVGEECQLTIEGEFYNEGAVTGAVVNNGVIYNSGALPSDVGGSIYNAPYLEVKGGSYAGELAVGQSVTVNAAPAPEGQFFAGWTVVYGDVTLTDENSESTTFTMPDQCIILQADYVTKVASITTADGQITYYGDLDEAAMRWELDGGTLTVLQADEDARLHLFMIPDNGVLDLGGNTVTTEWLSLYEREVTIQNGTLKIEFIDVGRDAVLDLKDVTISSRDEGYEVRITNNGTINDLGGVVIDDSVAFGDTVTYLEEDGTTRTLFQPHTAVSSASTEWTEGWYVVDGAVTIGERVKVSGDVKLILKDGAHLTAEKGISVTQGNTLTIYAQSTNENTMGQLTATGEARHAGIGGGFEEVMGTVVIRGGKITASGAEGEVGGAGIGGGENAFGGTIIISGGIIKATGGGESGERAGGAGIGGGFGSPVDAITITGGIIEATGNGGAAGIGGGGHANKNSLITITGGTITATGGDGSESGGAGIGGNVTISGGVVTAVGGNAHNEWNGGIGGAGIGCSPDYREKGTITITGGTVTVCGGNGDQAGGAGIGINIGMDPMNGDIGIEISGGMVDAVGGNNAAGIGSVSGGEGPMDSSAEIVIAGGTVTATGMGSADGIGNDGKDTFSTNTGSKDGNAVIFTNSIANTENQEEWKGLIFLDGQGKVYGDTYNLNQDLVVPQGNSLNVESGKTFTVESGITLTVAAGATLKNNGTIENNGVIHVDGTYVGEQPQEKPVSYLLTFSKGEGYTLSCADTVTVQHGEKFSFKVQIEEGYDGTDLVVKANGIPLTKEADGSYQAQITGNTTVTIEGVKKITVPEATSTPKPTSTPEPTSTIQPTAAPDHQDQDKGDTPEAPAGTATPAPVVTPTASPRPASSQPAATATPTPAPGAALPPVVIGVQVDAALEGDTGVAQITPEQMQDAVDAAMDEAQESQGAPVVELEVITPDEAKALQVTMPGAAIQALAENPNAAIWITSSVASINFDSKAFAAIADQAEGDVVLVIRPVAQKDLSEVQAQKVGEAPVFELTLQSGGKVISDFRQGNVTITIPYVLQEGQQPEGVVVWYLDEEGNTTICDTTYDAAAQEVTFDTPHFSKYVIGYDASRVPQTPDQQPQETQPEPQDQEAGDLPVIPILAVVIILAAVAVLVFRRKHIG